MKHIELNTVIVEVRHNAGTSEITALENKWGGHLIEVAALTDGMSIFSGWIWVRS